MKDQAERADVAGRGFDEAGLIFRAQEGDTAAFEALYRAHVGRVYAICLRLSGDAGRAEELTQTAFIQAWEKLHTFRGEGGLSGWLRRLAINVVFQDRRAEKRRRLRVVATDDEALLEHPVAPSAGLKIDLERAIAALPEGARTVLVLHDVEGYRHDEIAEMTGMAPGTSKAQLHMARRLLRGVLA